MDKIKKNEPIKIQKYMYEFTQEMGILAKKKSRHKKKKIKSEGTI